MVSIRANHFAPCYFPKDSSSFIAGERSALLRAFRETLPSQQAIGSLYHAVHQITGRMDQEACDVRKVQTAVVEVAASLQATSARLDGLEHMRIPQVEERLTDAESGPQSQGMLLLQQGQACALPLRPTSSRTVLGAVLFLGLVESLWQIHDRGIRLLPQQLRHATAPVQ
eukprot:jgi/Astpho2/5002/Aster-05940